MTAEFFALAFLAALNAKLLALDLLLIENIRPRLMFACILAGAFGTAVTFGLIDVLFVHADAIKAQQKPSAAVDLALGVILLVLGGLLVAGVVPRPRKQDSQAAGKKAGKTSDTDSRITRALREPRPSVAIVIGVLCGLPGGVYLAAMHNLVAGKYSTATLVAAVIVFCIIEFLLIIAPWVFLEIRPEATAGMLRRAQAWLAGHAKQLVAWVCLLLGAYLTISALVRLL